MMKSAQQTEFERYVKALYQRHKGKRIHRFEYAGQLFWLKQPDKLKGVWRILKPDPQQVFQKEIRHLQKLNADNAPVARLVCFGGDFMVLEDAGRSSNLCIEDETATRQFKQRVLNDCAQALAQLHKRGLVHGRPVLRDMAWRAGKVTFIDFEEHSAAKNIKWQKVRDCLIFIHSLFRTRVMGEQQEYAAVMCLQRHCDQQIWQALITFLRRWRWVYYLLLPFRPIAKMDLIAIYKLFENLLSLHKEPTK